MTRRRTGAPPKRKSQSKRAIAYRGGETFTQEYRPLQQVFTANDHEPRRECSVHAHTCQDCDTEIRAMEPCWQARRNDRRLWWHLPCLPDSRAP